MSAWRTIDPDSGLWTWEKTAGGVVLLRAVAMQLPDGDLLIDGGFVNNTMYCRLLAKLSGHERCYVNHATEGTAVGAGMLTVWNDDSSAAPLELTPVEPFEDPGLDAYAAQWERLAQAPA